MMKATNRYISSVLFFLTFAVLSCSTCWAQGEDIGTLTIEFDKTYEFKESKLVFIEGPGEYTHEWDGGSRSIPLDKGQTELIEIRPGDKLLRE